MSITITIPLGLLQAPGKLRNNASTNHADIAQPWHLAGRSVQANLYGA